MKSTFKTLFYLKKNEPKKNGHVVIMVRTMLGQMMTTAPCERCEGHGTVIENPCP